MIQEDIASAQRKLFHSRSIFGQRCRPSLPTPVASDQKLVRASVTGMRWLGVRVSDTQTADWLIIGVHQFVLGLLGQIHLR